jgi:hypothetical protein
VPLIIADSLSPQKQPGGALEHPSCYKTGQAWTLSLPTITQNKNQSQGAL